MESCALNGFFSPAQRARYLSAVSRRRSVRAYSDVPDLSQLSALNYAAARVCLPGVRIVLGEAPTALLFRKLPLFPTVTGTNRYAAIIVNESVPHAALHAGISGEAFILEATALNVSTCWVAFFKRGGVAIPLEPGEKVAAVTPLGVAGEPETPIKRKKLTEICSTDPAAWPLWAYNAAECVRVAPSAMNRQPWRLSFAGRTLLLSNAGMATSLDMGIALLHLSLGTGEKEHVIRWESGKAVASLVAEDRI